MSAPSHQDQVERLAFEACETAGVQLAENIVARMGLEAFEAPARVSAAAFASEYVPGMLAKLGMSGDAEALQGAIDVTMAVFDRRLAELRPSATEGGTA